MFLTDNNKPIHRSDIIWRTDLSELNIKFIVSDNFINHSWDKEPEESWNTLKKQRAQQLRDSYDYIIVYFSGGSDSITVVNSFLDNNLLIDEIVINGYSEIPDIRVNGNYAINYLKSRHYTGKITFNDLTSDKLIKIYNNEKLDAFNNGQGSAACNLRTNIEWFEQNNIIKQHIRKSNIAHVYGGITPIIEKIDNHYYNIISPKIFLLPSTQFNNIQFFTTEEFPSLHAKQCHILVRYMEKHNINRLVENESVEQAHIIRLNVRDEANPLLYFSKENLGSKNFYLNGGERLVFNQYYKQKNTTLLHRYMNSKLTTFLKNPYIDLKLVKMEDLKLLLN